MKVSHVFGSLALVSAITFSNQAFAVTNVTDLGNLNVAPAVDESLLQVGLVFLPDVYKFDLSVASDVTVDFFAVLGLNLGAKFDLYDSSDTFISSVNLPALNFFSGTSFTFSNIAAGNDYVFKYNPGVISTTVLSNLTFTATPVIVPVPEPETNALMLMGLGLIGFIARKKFA